MSAIQDVSGDLAIGGGLFTEGLSLNCGDRDSRLSSQSDESLLVSTHQPDCRVMMVYWNAQTPVLACVDTGCTKCLIGEVTLKQPRSQLLTKGVTVLHRPGTCNFRSGADLCCQAKGMAVIPCSVNHKCSALRPSLSQEPRHSCCHSLFLMHGRMSLTYQLSV